MILTIFLSLMGLAVLFLFYGWVTKTDLPRLIGFLLIFLLGAMIEPSLPGSIEYKTGVNSSFYYVYGDNYSGYHWDYASPAPSCNPNDLDCVKLFHVKGTDTNMYSTFEDHTIGFYIMIVGMLGFIMIMLERKRNRRYDDD